YTAQNEQFDHNLSDDFQKMIYNSVQVKEKEAELYNNGDNLSLNIGACKYADVILHGEKSLHKELSSIKSGRYKKVISHSEGWSEDVDQLLGVYSSLFTENNN